MSFDHIYKAEWDAAGVTQDDVANSRALVSAAMTQEFLDRENTRSTKMAQDIVTRNYLKHPILIQLESPFIGQVCSLIHLAEALTMFKDCPAISEYMSRLRKSDLYKAARLELEFAAFLRARGHNALPSYKTDTGEVDIYISEHQSLGEVFFECKTYNPPKPSEESRRNLFGYFMKKLQTLPKGYVICFKSHIEITEDNLKMIKLKIKSIFNNMEALYKEGNTHHDLFFGELDILYFEEITEDVALALRGDYNETVFRTMIPQSALKQRWEDISNPDKFDVEGKYRASALAFDLPLPKREGHKKVDYVAKAKSDIDGKISQHKHRLEEGKNICIVLEDIPAEDFMLLKKEVEDGLYKKYKKLAIVFVRKKARSRNLFLMSKTLKV